MTRIARKHGLVEKKVEKKIEEATPWESMINPATENPIDGDDFKEKEISKLKRHEEDYERRIQQENENNVNKKKRKARSKLEYEALLKQYSETIDKEVMLINYYLVRVFRMFTFIDLLEINVTLYSKIVRLIHGFMGL